jgi:hypothetical protein
MVVIGYGLEEKRLKMRTGAAGVNPAGQKR